MAEPAEHDNRLVSRQVVQDVGQQDRLAVVKLDNLFRLILTDKAAGNLL